MVFWNLISLKLLFAPPRPVKCQWRSTLAIGLGLSLAYPYFITLPVLASSVSPLPCTKKSTTNPPVSLPDQIPFFPPDSIPQDSIQLWWAKEQLDVLETGLITNWFAMPDAQQVDIIVDRQRWTQLNYLDRYRIVHQFATIAREHRYNLRIANQDNQCLVAYWCDFDQTPYQCQMTFAATAESNLPVYQFQRGDFNFHSSPPVTQPKPN
ncbi:MAG: hypothetical protein ACK58N_13055 [Synechocystis sp.]